MIPKIIHYCWFSDEKKPKSIQKCIDSWQRIMPDYEVRCWDGESFDFSSVDFTHEAMAAKKYAFAADYVRLFALYSQGGIYLDSDVFAYKPFDNLLTNTFFCGTEAFWVGDSVKYRMEAAIMGAEQGHPFLKACLDWYSTQHYTPDPSTPFPVMPEVISNMAQSMGYQRVNTFQQLGDNIAVYPTKVFTNALHSDFSNRDTLLAIHQNAGSWIDYSDRGWLYRFCRKHDLMSLYSALETIKNRK